MTALCGGGTSGPNIGASAVVDFSTGALATALAKIGGLWMIPIIGVVGLAPLALSTFCGTDPPAMVALTQQEADALLQLTLGADFTSGLAKLPAIFQNAIWNDQCRCTSGAYTPPVAPAQPANSATVVLPKGTVSVPCYSFNNVLAIVGATSVQLNFKGLASIFRPDATLYTFTLDWHDLKGTATTATVQFSTSGTGGPKTYAAFTMVDGAHTVYNLPASVTDTDVIIVLTVPVAIPVPGGVLDYNVDDYCGGGPGVIPQPCCPPDAATQATLQTILSLVTSIQRNYAPFGYVPGLAHATLTGNGSVSVSRLIGVKITVTAFPGSDVQLPGNPAYVKDLGWLSVSEVDGMLQERRVARLAETWFPELMPIADHINYALNPGVTVTLTELKAEP